MPASPLRRKIDLLGSAVIVAYLAMAAMSYIQAPALWAPAYAPNATAFFTEFYGNHHVAAMRAFFGGPFAVLAYRFVPLIVASLAAIMLIILVSRDDRRHDDAIAPRVLRWAFAFSAVSFLAYPVFTQDFWLSAVWGDMAASGANPYHEKFTPEMLTSFPLDHFPMTMSYGPLWALISAAVMTLAGGSLLVAAILFKSVLLAAWCGSLVLIDRIMREAAPRHRVMALVIVGWVPLGVTETVAEGHNDIMLVFPALLWLFLLLQQRKLTAPFALAASVMCKYTTAPLFVVDLLHYFRGRRLSVKDYVLRMVPAALFGLVVFGLFFRSFSFFDGVLLVDSWHFMQPSDAFLAVSDLFNGWPEPLEIAMLAIFPAIAIYQAWIYWNAPDTDNVLRLALATMCAVSFSLIGHVWPWYLVWTLPLAALVPGWWLSRFIVGLSLAAPFTAIVWWVPAAEEFKNEAALVMYAAAVLWACWTAREEPEVVSRTAQAPVRLIDFMRFKNAQAGARPARRTVAVAYDADAPAPAKVASGEN